MSSYDELSVERLPPARSAQEEVDARDARVRAVWSMQSQYEEQRVANTRAQGVPEVYSAVGRKEWMTKAACKGLTMYFFPEYMERKDEKVARELIAKMICDHCSVVKTCLEYALANRETGFWGGYNDEDRSALLPRAKPGRKPKQ